MIRSTLTTVVITALAVPFAACDAPESDDEPTQATLFPDAPSPTVRQAVLGAALDVEEGEATFYADEFEGRRTASGRAFRHAEMVAAHRAFPFGTRLRVTNLRNDRAVEVRVVDRGPYGNPGDLPAVLDLSSAAAERLDFIGAGRAQVRVEVLEWGTPRTPASG